jgi:nitroreductase
MEVHEALCQRSSVRAFQSTPLDQDRVRRVVERALQSPSWANTQPYRLALATGGTCEALRHEMLAAARSEMPASDHPLLFPYPDELQVRRRATGFGLYAALGIGRDDRVRREQQFLRNFAFFDAPAVAFLFAHQALGVYSVLDAGVFLQSLLLAGVEEGLGMCAQAALASYPQIVRRHFAVPDDYRLLCGISIGEAADDPANRFRPTRIGIDDLLCKPRRYSAATASAGVAGCTSTGGTRPVHSE